jgi:membrane protease subunit HflC
VGVIASTAVYQVGQGRQAVVLRFGQPVRVVNAGAAREAGLHLKWPLVEQAVLFNRAEQSLDAPPLAMATADHMPLNVEGYVRYRIVDPVRFQAAQREGSGAEPALQRMLDDSLRDAVGRADALDLAAGRDTGVAPAATAALRRRAAAEHIGIEVAEAGVLRADPSAAQSEAIFARMRAAATTEAARVRADGEEQRQTILADADVQAADIRGDAEADAARIRGEGEARRIAILADAYGKDPAFARYFRQLEAYQNTLTQGDTTLVLSPDNAFLHDFAQGAGGVATGRK